MSIKPLLKAEVVPLLGRAPREFITVVRCPGSVLDVFEARKIFNANIVIRGETKFFQLEFSDYGLLEHAAFGISRHTLRTELESHKRVIPEHLPRRGMGILVDVDKLRNTIVLWAPVSAK